MARKVIWSDEALTDLETLTSYISKDSTFYAVAMLDEIITASRNLSNLSERGRIVPEFEDPHIREIFVRKYRLIYKIKNTEVLIVTLVHGARDFLGMIS